ncbi:hypothetical protein H5V45_05265 [Nocardioides sp. KIGAM211]|uniref:Uncharacterized protein n=1 Tax=Nocardioides luti TaxID=2761101 RepID=A0A7X0V9J4_9ACTN|nr:hypothetical protein [Nocardioides luti]MBB6626729.1 hypothetical protein [Nocardioides luti]
MGRPVRYDHRRPLVAFVIVALACGLIVANGLRSQAVVGFLHRGVQHVVAGTPLQPAPAPAAPAAPAHPRSTATSGAPSRARVAAVPAVRTSGHAGPRVHHPRGSAHVGRGHHARLHPSPGHGRGHEHGSHGRGHAHGAHGHGHGHAHSGHHPRSHLEHGHHPHGHH